MRQMVLWSSARSVIHYPSIQSKIRNVLAVRQAGSSAFVEPSGGMCLVGFTRGRRHFCRQDIPISCYLLCKWHYLAGVAQNMSHYNPDFDQK
ncbi:MAG: hypothetical protein LWW83_12545 [Azonexaceae bacterium]|nr:hypothetical protein [Azonexaceae bacterium]